MTEESVRLGIEVTGDLEAIADLDKVKQAQDRITASGQTQADAAGRQSRRVQQSMAQMGTSATAAGNKWGELAGAINSVGSVVGLVSPEFAALGGTIGAVGSASTALTGALGPVGVALAVATTAVGVYALAMQHAERRTNAAANAALNATRSFEQTLSLQRQITAARRRDELLNAGLSDVDEQTAFANQAGRRVGQLRQQLRNIEEQRARLARGSFDDRVQAQALRVRGEQLETQLAEAQAESARRGALARQAQAGALAASEDAAEEMRIQAARTAPATGGGGRGSSGPSQAEQMQAQRELMTGIMSDLDAVNARREAEAALFNETYGSDAMAQAERRASAFAQNRVNESAEVLIMGDRIAADTEAWHERVRASHAAAVEATAQAAEDSRLALEQSQTQVRQIESEMWGNLGGTVKSLMGDVFKFIIEGNLSSGDAFVAMLDQFLQATALEYSIKALAEAANAVAAAASYRYDAAAQHATAAGLYVGVAAATGIASAAIQSPAAGSGGSAGSSASLPAGGAGGAPQGGGNVTINLYAPNAIMTEAERGQLLQSSIRAAEREYGAGRF